MRKGLLPLQAHLGTDTVVRIDRTPLDESLLEGFVVGMSDRLLLLQVVDGSTLVLNGYSAVRLSDIRRFRVDETFVARALRLLGRAPLAPEGLDLSSWPALLTSAARQFPLIGIECEARLPGSILIGRPRRIGRAAVAFHTVDPNAQWSDVEDVPFKDITQVEFEDGYISALAAVMEAAGLWVADGAMQNAK